MDRRTRLLADTSLILLMIVSNHVFGKSQQALHKELDQLAQEVESQVIAWRRDIHEHPELGNREFRTAGMVADHLKKLGLEVKTGIAHTGVVGILRGNPEGPVVALRADMDALPLTEATGLPYASKVRTTFNGEEVGVMHACGHDAHTAILMGVAHVLAQVRGDLPGTVKFIFQPAEEGAPIGEEGGAGLMVAEGVLKNPTPSAIFGLHNGPGRAGTIKYRCRGMMASVDDLHIVVHGRQGHGGMPWVGTDAVVVSAQIISGLQTIASRQIETTKAAAVISVCTIHGGNRQNILPDKVEMTGTVRTLDPEMRQSVHRRIRRTVTMIAESAGTTAEVKIDAVSPVVYNDPELTASMLPTFQRIFEKNNINDEWSPMTAGEDFAFYQKEIPGLFFFLGMEPAENKDSIPVHHPRFTVDESGFIYGVEALSNLAVDYLDMQSNKTGRSSHRN